MLTSDRIETLLLHCMRDYELTSNGIETLLFTVCEYMIFFLEIFTFVMFEYNFEGVITSPWGHVLTMMRG